MPTNEPLNTLPIQHFIQLVKGAKNSRSKEVRIDINQADNLVYTLGLVMSRLHGDLEKIVMTTGESESEIEVSLDGGSDWGS